MRSQPEFRLGSTVAGKYRLVRILGQGGMGTVFEALNLDIGRRVAVKLLNRDLVNDAESAQRFELEARAAAVINHPGIVDVLDSGKAEDGSRFIVMEYLEGLTLHALQRAAGPMTPGQVSALVAPVLDALAAAHAAGVIHRDLKPGNIFLSVRPTPIVKILDFGISKFTTRGDGITRTGVTLGTLTYMAPEQLKSGKNVGVGSDLYAIGAVLYALLADTPPFDAENDVELVAKILTTQHTPIANLRPDLPTALCGLVDGLLAKDPAARPPNARVAQQRLLAIAAPDARGIYAIALRQVPPSKPDIAIESRATPDDGASLSQKDTVSARKRGPQGGAAPRSGWAPQTRWMLGGGAALAAVGATAAVLLSTPVPAVVAPVVVAAVQPGPVTAQQPVPPEPAASADAGEVVAEKTSETPAEMSVRVPEKKRTSGTRRGKNSKVIIVGATDAPGTPGNPLYAALDRARELSRVGRAQEGRELLNKSIEAALEAHDQDAQAHAYRCRGNFSADQGRCAEAIADFERAFEIFQRRADGREAGKVANDLGLLAVHCSAIDAPRWFTTAYDERWKANDFAGAALVAINLSYHQLAYQRDRAGADKTLARAIEAAQRAGDLKTELKAHATAAGISMEVEAFAAGATQGWVEAARADPKKFKKSLEHARVARAQAKQLGLREEVICRDVAYTVSAACEKAIEASSTLSATAE